MVDWARSNDWRIPEHFDGTWQPQFDHNAEQSAHPFRPFGATIGHGLEWARLLVATHLSLGVAAPPGLVPAAIALTDRAIRDGWAVDGADGFIYTTDWNGRPVVHTRMHWVVAEAINTATTLYRETQNPSYADLAVEWWSYAERFLIDAQRGSWHHELDPANSPSSTIWVGKPDIYHAYQAALLPEVPTVPSFASALAKQGGVRR